MYFLTDSARALYLPGSGARPPSRSGRAILAGFSARLTCLLPCEISRFSRLSNTYVIFNQTSEAGLIENIGRCVCMFPSYGISRTHRKATLIFGTKANSFENESTLMHFTLHISSNITQTNFWGKAKR